MLILICSVFVTSASSINFKDKPRENILGKDISLNNDESNLEEKISNIKDKVRNVTEKIKNIDLSNNRFFGVVKTLSQGQSSTLSFNIKYDGEEKTVGMNMFSWSYIDINSDDQEDIRARVFLYPSIVKPFALAINFRVSIELLEGFEELDDEKEFSAYTKIAFPGFLVKNITGDTLSYGYESPGGEKIPADCTVTYRFVPHLLFLREKPEHHINIKPDESTVGNEKLNLILSYEDVEDNSIVTKDTFKVKYNKAANSEIIFGRQGFASFNFERVRTENTNVNLELTHKKGGDTTYAYVKNLPEKISLKIDMGSSGIVEFDSHGDSADEFGICDSFENPTYKFYFTNFATKAGIQWNRNLLQGQFDLRAYTHGPDVTFNADINDPENGIGYLEVTSSESYDASFEMDLSQGFIIFDRTNVDLDVSFDIQVFNETLDDYISSLVGSFTLSNTFDDSFEIWFDKLKEGVVEVELFGKSLEIDDLQIMGSSPLIGGDFEISFDSLVKQKAGSISTSLSIQQDNGNISGSCRFFVEHGVQITDFSLKYNEFEFHRSDVDISGTITRWYNFSINISLEWHVYDDWGYVLIHAGSLAMFSFNSVYKNTNGDPVGHIMGNIRFEVINRPFNISWRTIDGNISFSIDGMGVAELEDLQFCFEDKIDVSIPHLLGQFTIHTDGATKSGSLSLLIDEFTYSADLDIEKINITDLFDITLKAGISIDLDGSASGSLDIAWNESGINYLNGSFNAGVTGSIELKDFVFSYGDSLVDISFNEFSITGELNVTVGIEDDDLSIVANVGLTNINISDLSVSTSLSSPLPVAVDLDVTFTGEGFIDFSYIDDVIVLNGAVYDDSDIVINTLWFVVPDPSLPIELNVEALYIHGATTITFNVDTSEDIPVQITFTTDSTIEADSIYIGYPGVLQIFLRDFVADASDGYISIGFNQVTGQPVIGIQKSYFSIGSFILIFQGMQIPASNIEIEGSAQIEGFLDLTSLSWVYLYGDIYEETRISSVDNDFSLIFEPGKLDIIVQQNLLDLVFALISGGEISAGDYSLYLYGYSSGYIKIELEGEELLRLKGTVDLWVDLHISEENRISLVVDGKEASGVLATSIEEVLNVLTGESYPLPDIRLAGEINGLLKFAGTIQKENSTITISNIDINISGNLNAVIQIKTNETGWMPILPFSSTGQVVLLTTGPKLTGGTYNTPSDNSTLQFEAWYAPPIGFENEDLSPFTYSIDFDDGDTYEVTTDDTRIIKEHNYVLGTYNPTVSVTTSDPSIDPVYDDMNIELIQKITYLTINKTGPKIVTYEDVESDGRLRTWFEILNKDDEDYILEWEAGVFYPPGVQEEYDFDFDPETGFLNPQETKRIDVSFLPPADHKEHSGIFVGADNIDYAGPGEDGDSFILTIRQSLSSIPSDIYLPDIAPGDSIDSSLWIWNNKDSSLNWSITDYPNQYYSFSSTEGTIPYRGAEVVHFTVDAPNQDGVDLSGDINITDINSPENIATSYVDLKTKGGSGGGGQEGVDVTSDGENVSIRIGGYIDINVNSFTFTINGKSGFLNGHFYFESVTDYVYINYSSGGEDLIPITVEGTGEFYIDDFIFTFEDSIDMQISYIAGRMEFREGRSGNFSLIVDESSLNVDIDVNLDYGPTPFVLQGMLTVDIISSSKGYFWVDWDLTSDSPFIKFGGDLQRDGTFEFSLTTLLFQLDGVDISANEIGVTGSGGNLLITDDIIEFDAGIDQAVVDTLILDIDINEFPVLFNSIELNGEFNFIGDVGLTIKVTQSMDFYLQVDGGLTLVIDNFYIEINENEFSLSCTKFDLTLNGDLIIYSASDLSYIEITVNANAYAQIDYFDLNIQNGALIVEWDQVILSGYGTVYIGSYLELDATLSLFNVDNLYLYASSSSLTFSGNIDLSLSGKLYIKSNFGSELEIRLTGSGYIDLTSFNIILDGGAVTASGTRIKLSASGYGSFKTGGDIEIDASLTSLIFDNCNFHLSSKDIYLDSTIDISGSGHVYIKTPADLSLSYFELELDGSVEVDLTNFYLDINNGVTIVDAYSIGLSINVNTGYVKFKDDKLFVNGDSGVSAGLSLSASNCYIDLNNSEHSIDVTSLSISLNADADQLIIDFDKNDGIRADIYGAGGSFTIENTDIKYSNSVISPDYHQFQCTYFDITLSGTTGFVEFVDKILTIDATGQLNIDITTLTLIINSGEIKLEVPLLSLNLGASVGEISIDLSSSDNGGGGGGGNGEEDPVEIEIKADMTITGNLAVDLIVYESQVQSYETYDIDIIVEGSGSVTINNFLYSGPLPVLGDVTATWSSANLQLSTVGPGGGRFLVQAPQEETLARRGWITIESLSITGTINNLEVDFIDSGKSADIPLIDAGLTFNSEGVFTADYHVYPAEDDNDLGTFHVNLDTNAQDFLQSVSLKVVCHCYAIIGSQPRTIGLHVDLNQLVIADWVVHGTFVGTIPPVGNVQGIGWSGSITANGFIRFAFNSGHLTFNQINWLQVYPWKPVAVLDKDTYYANQNNNWIVTFDTSDSDGMIFPLTKMRFDWDGDGNWDTGTWPNHWINYQEIKTHDYSDLVGVHSSVTVRFQVKTAFSQSDVTTATVVIQESPNEAPELTTPTINPNSGPSTDPFTYNIIYSDSNGDPPTMRRVYIKEQSDTTWNYYNMNRVGSNPDYQAGVTYEYTTYLDPGDYECYFEFSDGEFTTREPTTGSIQLPHVYAPPSGDWVSPDGNSDPSIDWNRESDAYDGSTSTSAESNLRAWWEDWQWTGWLELTFNNDVYSNKVRFNALYSAEYIRWIEVDAYYNGIWNDVCLRSFNNEQWDEAYLGASVDVSKVRVRFNLQGCLGGCSAELYEFELWDLNAN